MQALARVIWPLLAAAILAACSASPPRPPVRSAGPGPPAQPTTTVPRTPAQPATVVSTRSPHIVLPPSALSQDQQIRHVLDRLGYGPRPGDLERVKRTGLATYIERQLAPWTVPDSAVDEALPGYRALSAATAELVKEYPRPTPQEVQKRDSGEMTAKQMAEAFPPERRPVRITEQMQAAKLFRVVTSARQLQEVMVDFWFNHFNVFAQKGAVRWMLPAYEREAIRPHALGRFRDLLLATARHPAMLFYLDNWASTRADFVPTAGPNKGRALGLNENYARELLELHTLGVDGGYTQQDVIEVARCFTGWTIDRPQLGGGFVFRAQTHDQRSKRVLGHVIPAGGGEQDGLQVIDLLSRHPSTARFVSAKLVRRFVGDDPPPALVERAAAKFRDTDGDIRAVLAVIVSSPEFFSTEAYRAKIKTPLELVASAARTMGGELDVPAGEPAGDGGLALARQVARLGEPLYEAAVPTGYADRAEAWVNTGALLGRMNFALALAQGRLPGVRVALDSLVSGADGSRPEDVLGKLLVAALHGEVTHETRTILTAQLSSPEIARTTADDRVSSSTDLGKLAALVLGSPEFQRR